MTACSSKRRNFTLLNITDIPSDLRGIYGLWFKKWCIYIGKAKDQGIKNRLKQHWLGSHNEYLKAWIEAKNRIIEFCYIDSPRHTIDSLEKRMIDILQPVTNKDGKEQ